MGQVRLLGVTRSFTEAGSCREVLRGIDATLPGGAFTALLGKSGSGKSTLLNLISGIDAPSAGAVWIDAVEVSALDERDRTLFRRDRLGIVFQSFQLIPTLSVLDNVTLPQQIAGASPAATRDSGLRWLQRVGLEERAATFPDRLSGGEQQRVAIARALAHDPCLVLADEPTGNLDPATGAAILALLLEVTREAGKALVMATHSMDVVALADRVFRMVDGRIEEASSPAGSPSYAEQEALVCASAAATSASHAEVGENPPPATAH